MARPFGASQACRKHVCVVNICVSYTRAWHGHLAQVKYQDLDASISDEADLVGIESLPSHLVEFSKERTWTGPSGMVQTGIRKRLYINAPHSLVVTVATLAGNHATAIARFPASVAAIACN